MGKIFCLTGQMAAGKNYVCSLLENENCVSVDLDKLGHRAINECSEKIISEFAPLAELKSLKIQNEDGSINRKTLAELLFSDKKLLAVQESIVYPKIVSLTKEFIEQNNSEGRTIFLNATVLFKTPELMNMCSAVFFVKANFFKRIIRAKRRDKIPLMQILKRFRAQKNLFDEYKKTGIPVITILN